MGELCDVMIVVLVTTAVVSADVVLETDAKVVLVIVLGALLLVALEEVVDVVVPILAVRGVVVLDKAVEVTVVDDVAGVVLEVLLVPELVVGLLILELETEEPVFTAVELEVVAEDIVDKTELVVGDIVVEVTEDET